MDCVRAAGWTRFKPVKGQPIAEKDMRKIFKLVDLDKDGTISHLVTLNLFSSLKRLKVLFVIELRSSNFH